MTALSDAPPRDPIEPSPEHRSVPRLVIVAGVVIGLAGLFFYFYTRSALWLDEALTVNIARLPLSDLHAALKQDGAPPLFYVVLHFWTAAFGTGNVAVRSLSGVFMVGATVAIWFAARRFAGVTAAWIAVVLMAVNPYAIRYATEARMYSLEILFVATGLLAVQRALERPSVGRLVAVALLVAGFIYTQYWAFYLLAVVVVLLAYLAWRGVRRDATLRTLAAMAIGGLAFVPWLPTFLYQRAHTGTPWGIPILPAIPFGYTLHDFAGGMGDLQEAWALFFILTAALFIGVFGHAIDGRRIELDLWIPRGVRAVAFLFAFGLAVALTLNYFAGGAFQTRYSVIVFPFYVLLVSRGLTLLRDPRVLGGVLAVVVVLGVVGGVRNVVTRRTQAPEVAGVLRREAKPGDLVVYCPDQVGPAVHRLAPMGLREVVFPSFAGPERIDWVDYKARVNAANIKNFANEALARAGTRTLWYVSAPGYITHTGKCEALSDAFAVARTRLQRTQSDANVWEKPALQMFPARAPG